MWIKTVLTVLIFLAMVFWMIFPDRMGDNLTGAVIDESQTKEVNYDLKEKYIVEGRVGNALKFDKNNYVKLDNEKLNVIGEDDFSIMAWFKPQIDYANKEDNKFKVGYGVQDVMYKGNPYGKWISFTPRTEHNDGGALWFQFDDNLTTISTTSTMIKAKTNVKDDKWHHGSVTFERDRDDWIVKIYVDGELENEKRFENFGLFNTSDPLVLGRPFYDGEPGKPAPSDNLYGYRGLVDEFYAFNRILFEDEIREIYEHGLRGHASNISYDNLLVYLSFENYDDDLIYMDEGNYSDNILVSLIIQEDNDEKI